MFSEASHEASCCEASVLVFCAKGFFGVFFLGPAGVVRVLEILESPGILLWHFPGLESLGK